jgi:hypothetical protein
MSFDAAFYYMIVTVSTVGFGDIYPKSDTSRSFIGIFIVVIIVVLSKQTSELNELIKVKTPIKNIFNS